MTAAVTAKELVMAKVGQPAPDFNMPSTKNMETLAENVKLSDYVGKWLILMFYPLDFTFLPARFHVRLSDRIDGFFRPSGRTARHRCGSHRHFDRLSSFAPRLD